MKRNNVISIRNIKGGMERDTELIWVQPENYRYANNIDGGYGVLIDGKTVHDGTSQINYELPEGSFVCIGAFENKVDSSIIYFISDTTTGKLHEFDMILEYRNDEIQILLRGDFLNFTPDWRVHSVEFIDGVMYWTDAVDLEGIPEGNPPRHINLERHRPGKFIKYQMVFDEDAFQTGVEYTYELTDLDGNTIAGPTLFSTIVFGAGAPYNDQMLQLFNDLTTAGFVVESFPVNTPENPARVINFYWPVKDTRIIITVAGGISTPEVLVTETNFYPLPGSLRGADINEQITILKPCPQYELEPEYEQDPAISRSNVWGQSFKFR